jgi:uncharacterized protein YkwD
MTHVFAVFAAAFLLFAAAPAAVAAPQAASETSFLRAVNAARSANGLRPLHLDASLGRAARYHSLEMLRGNYFDHGDFAGRMSAFHVRAGSAGENLAWGTGPYGQPKTVVAEWLASPGHRANLLNAAYKRIGLGVVSGNFQGYGGAVIVTADFAG